MGNEVGLKSGLAMARQPRRHGTGRKYSPAKVHRLDRMHRPAFEDATQGSCAHDARMRLQDQTRWHPG